MAEDISRKTDEVVLDKELSQEIITKAIEDSAFMKLADRMTIAGSGKKYQTIAGDPEPEWVGETDPIAVGKFTFGKKEVEPYKMALIVPFSNEFLRDKAALYEECSTRLPKLFGKKFDQTVMGTTPPGENFDALGAASSVSINPAEGKTVYNQFVAIDGMISAANGIMSGIALAPAGKSKVLDATDAVGHPLFTPGVESGTVGNILGASVSVNRGVLVPGTAQVGTAGQAGYVAGVPSVVGLAGDFEEARWGAVEAIKGSISHEASIAYPGEDGEEVTLHLWQRGMFAIRFIIELAFLVRDVNKFVRITGDVPQAA